MDWATISLICGASMSFVGLATFLTVKVVPFLRKWSRVADRILGVPADPKTGQAAIPSIWERLDHQDEQLGVIKHEVEYNNGSSVKDAVRRTENTTKEVKAQLDAYIAGKSEVAATTVTVNTGAAA